MVVNLLASAAFVCGQAGTIPPGDSKIDVDLGGTRFEVYTYRPAAFDRGPLLVVFTGAARNAEAYRDDARGLADRLGALAIVPYFDRDRFPASRYQRGALVRDDGVVTSREEWTWNLMPSLVDEIRRRENRPDMPFDVIGHSAGGQLVLRMAAFVDTGARRIVAANPGTWLFPTRDEHFTYPYGFGGLPDELSDDGRICRYLGQPLTVYLGTKDDVRDEELDDSEEGDRQGNTRLDRGRTAYREAKQLAGRMGWPFRWRLVEAPGIAHDHKGMFDSPSCIDALSDEPAAP